MNVSSFRNIYDEFEFVFDVSVFGDINIVLN